MGQKFSIMNHGQQNNDPDYNFRVSQLQNTYKKTPKKPTRFSKLHESSENTIKRIENKFVSNAAEEAYAHATEAGDAAENAEEAAAAATAAATRAVESGTSGRRTSPRTMPSTKQEDNELRIAYNSEVVAEIEGKVEAIDEQLDSGTVKGRNVTRLKAAKEDLKSNVKATRTNMKKRGATKNQLYPDPIPLGHAFDPIRNGNGPIEHIVV